MLPITRISGAKIQHLYGAGKHFRLFLFYKALNVNRDSGLNNSSDCLLD